MELRTCEYCGTEYNTTEPKCPICGGGSTQETVEQSASPKRRLTSSAGARAAGKKKGRYGPWGAISAVLGVAVMTGIVLFFLHMDFFREGGFDFNAIPTNLPEYNYENQESLAAQQPAEEDVPEETPAEDAPAVITDPDSKACTGLTISQSAVTMDEAGGKIFLTAVARPSDCEDPILFASSDESVVTVTENGMITAVAPGQAEIIVTCGTVTKVCTIDCVFEVEEPVEEEPEEEPEEETPVESEPEEKPEDEPEETPAPTLSSTDFTLFYPGEETTLTVKNAPEGAVITYVSSNASVVTVDNNGKVTAKGDGDATITVTVGDIKLTCTARCRMDSTTEGGSSGSYTGPFKLSHTDVTLFSSGESFTLTLVDANGKTVSGVGWFASNGAVTISGNQIKAAASGQATVSCVYNGETYSCIVRCSF